MVSKRQREARRKFRAEHPELAKQPTPPKDPTKKKEKKSSFKRKKAPSDPAKPSKNPHRKHPLRVPGMKPGDSCFICKSTEHIAKLCPEKVQWDKHKICLYCRQRGHSIKNCLNKKDDSVAEKLCYNCGENGHSLSNCPYPLEDEICVMWCVCVAVYHTSRLTAFFSARQHAFEVYMSNAKVYIALPDILYQQALSLNNFQLTSFTFTEFGGTKFAKCFICNGTGHLSKNCPQNTHGIYPKGGSCKICGGVTHLAKDCPNKSSSSMSAGRSPHSWKESDLPRGKVTKFLSGDDLEDDFSFIDEKKNGVTQDKSADTVGPASLSQESTVKSKKKQGPKVVNFVG